MKNLITNEFVKIFSRAGTYVMVGMIVILVMGMAGLAKYEEYDNPPKENPQWKTELQKQLVNDRAALDDFGMTNANLRAFYEREIAIKEYRLKKDMAPPVGTHVWSFVNNSQNFISFVGLFTIVIAAGIVSSEFSWGTVKLLLIRPISRPKILLSKYLTVLLFGLGLLALLFVFSFLAGLILFGFSDSPSPHLVFSDGHVYERSMGLQLIAEYLLSSIDVLMVATMAFMISAVFRNSSLAIGISLFLLLTGGTLTMLLAGKFEWAKYFLFANTDLTVYLDGTPLISGMTLGFSITMLVIYFTLFQFFAFWVFSKRDVAA
ncbi:ABC transporter permease [Neobacillus notoginsengisoli]|uniref:ABC transporter permease n=1 Tax=Neobacillus notoginsengisoli TaxID=1578198 RepID=A0A417YPQ6_9BACI|nr:ABC transporter permease [Neobacillus notoginsengisoli]RHW35677.1 ABC transporter permease [Neobacillus notoginsengisoli]